MSSEDLLFQNLVDKIEFKPLVMDDLPYVLSWVTGFSCSSTFDKDVSSYVVTEFYKAMFESNFSTSFFIVDESGSFILLVDVCKADMDLPVPSQNIHPNDLSINLMVPAHYTFEKPFFTVMFQKCLQYLKDHYSGDKIFIPIYSSNTAICELLDEAGSKIGFVSDKTGLNDLYIIPRS